MSTQERIVMESMLTIADKQGNDVPFKLNSAQRDLDATLTGRDVIPKARQRGISTYFLGRYFVKCLVKRNTKAVIISHESKATQRMLQKIHYFIDMMDPKPVVKNASKNEITFPKTNSAIYIGTAGATEFGRGDTINCLHCSEIAYWPSPVTLMTGLMQAVPTVGAEVAIESTGNGVGNYYHRLCMRAASEQSQYRCHFYSWLDEPDYDLILSPEKCKEILANLDPTPDDVGITEYDLINKWKLTAGQIQFRRNKLEEIDGNTNKFKQEYPLTLDECFQASGRSIFNKVNYEPTSLWKRYDRYLHLLDDHPRDGCYYLIGADPAGGTGGDNSVVQILNLETMEQVGEWVDNRIEPDIFGQKLVHLGKWFNNAFMTVESNNHGIVTMNYLREHYEHHLLYIESKREKKGANEVEALRHFGFRTTVSSKPFIIGKLRKFLKHDITLHSELARNELSTFIETESGSMEAEEGCKDDRVMALAMTVAGVEKGAMAVIPFDPRPIAPSFVDPFTFEGIIEGLGSKSKLYPIEEQVL